MKTFTFLISTFHSKMGGQGGCVVAEDRRTAFKLICQAAAFHEIDLSEEHIIRLTPMSDLGVMFFEHANCYGE